MNKLAEIYGLIEDVNPVEIQDQIERGNLAGWCNSWKEAIVTKIKQPAPRIVKCENCKWWAREKDDHGRCELLCQCTAGHWFCASGDVDERKWAIYFMGECIALVETWEEAEDALRAYDNACEIVEITDENRERILEDYGD